MKKIKLSELSIEKIEKEKFSMPYIYELKKVIESTRFHPNQSVFNHTIKTLKELRKLIKKYRCGEYLSKKVDKNTKKELLFLAALLHDIGKKLTVGNDSFPPEAHEKIGAVKAKEHLSDFDLSPNEKKIVIYLVKSHGEIHRVFDEKKLPKMLEKFESFRKKYSKFFVELCLLGLADTLALNWKENEEGRREVRFVGEILNNI